MVENQTKEAKFFIFHYEAVIYYRNILMKNHFNREINGFFICYILEK